MMLPGTGGIRRGRPFGGHDDQMLQDFLHDFGAGLIQRGRLFAFVMEHEDAQSTWSRSRRGP